MRVVAALASVLFLLLAGCSKAVKLQSKESVRAAIESHLQQRQGLMMTNMTLEVSDVKFSGDTADADVKFRSKQSPDLFVSVHYKLRRASDHWQVESGGAEGNPHGPAGGGNPHLGSTPLPPTQIPATSPLQSSH